MTFASPTSPVPSDMLYYSYGVLIRKCGCYLCVCTMDVMYLKERLRAQNLYTMASSLVFSESTKCHENKIQIPPECLVSR